MGQVFILLLLVLIFVVFVIYALFLLIDIGWRKYRQKDNMKNIKRLKRTSIVLGGCFVMAIGFSLLTQSFTNTPQIVDENGQQKEGSIAELCQVELNGRKEWISIRGENQDNPLLLFLAGGPGGTQLAATRYELKDLEKYFTVVGWDQPGSGKSYHAVKSSELTVQTYIDDGHALTQYLLQRFQQEKIYLVGESWGSALGIFLIKEYPENYHAFIGTGQMVDFLETEKLDYEKALEIAQSRQDTQKIKVLKENGYPPYNGSDMVWKSAEYLNYLSSYMTQNQSIAQNGYNTIRDIMASEYGIIDKINYLRGIVTTFNHVYPQLYDIDLRQTHNQLEVPVYFFEGRHDINAPTAFVEDYVAVLKAPKKEIIWFEHSGHSPWINENQKFIEELVKIKENH